MTIQTPSTTSNTQPKFPAIARELAFTETYRRHEQDHPIQRELACMRSMYPGWFTAIQPGDWFAGRPDAMLVGITTEGCGYYCNTAGFQQLRNEPDADPELRDEIDRLLSFWAGRTTAAKCREAFPAHLQQGLPSDAFGSGLKISYPLYRIAGLYLDFDRLLQRGLNGLREDIKQQQEKAGEVGADRLFLAGMLESLNIVSETALWYSQQARQMKAENISLDEQHRLEMIASSLDHIAYRAPETFHQAIQLFWLYILMAHPLNYGRMDVFLGDFLAADLETGRLTETEAVDMLVSLWRLIIHRGNIWNNRVILGGKGRRNEANADRFALLALKAQEITHDTLPMLSLRWYEGMNRKVWDRSIDLIAQGNTYPILYNDDVNIPGVAQAFDISLTEAEQYQMFGCGEYVIGHSSVGTPNGITNLMKALNVTLHNGLDPFTGCEQGLKTGEMADFHTFEDLWLAYIRQVRHQIDLLADAQVIIYQVCGQDVAMPLVSLLMDDCLARGKPLLQGGVRYLGGTLETYGNNSAGDALLAIQTSVYEKGWFSGEQLIEILDRDFVGYEREQRKLSALPKFGNDHPEADDMSLRLNHFVLTAIRDQRNRTELHSYLAVMINNSFSVTLGQTTSTSADGRKSGESLSNGNQPRVGCDRQGLTALLNSMAKLDPGLHAGAVQNIKLSRHMFSTQRLESEALLKGYFAQGGTQAMITVVDRGELEAAMLHPENYGYLMVRIGGYSERFVNLSRELQLEVIRRTLY